MSGGKKNDEYENVAGFFVGGSKAACAILMCIYDVGDVSHSRELVLENES